MIRNLHHGKKTKHPQPTMTIRRNWNWSNKQFPFWYSFCFYPFFVNTEDIYLVGN